MSKELKTNVGEIEPSGNDLINKESTPLKALQNLTEYLTGDYRDCFEELSIIKTALEKLEEIETTTHSVLREDISKKLKALEIIKEKEVNVYWLIHSLSLNHYNEEVCIFRMLAQEEYDLLKEVLR